MYKQKYSDAKSMCEFGQYIDDQYICIETGEVCKLGMHPNRYDCRDYSKYKNNNREIQNYGTINGSGNVDL